MATMLPNLAVAIFPNCMKAVYYDTAS